MLIVCVVRAGKVRPASRGNEIFAVPINLSVLTGAFVWKQQRQNTVNVPMDMKVLIASTRPERPSATTRTATMEFANMTMMDILNVIATMAGKVLIATLLSPARAIAHLEDALMARTHSIALIAQRTSLVEIVNMIAALAEMVKSATKLWTQKTMSFLPNASSNRFQFAKPPPTSASTVALVSTQSKTVTFSLVKMR